MFFQHNEQNFTVMKTGS